MEGRTEAALTTQISKLKADDKLNPNYWKARLKENSIEVPEIPKWSPTLGAEKKSAKAVEIQVGGMTQLLGPGSFVTLKVDGLNIEISVNN